MIVGIALTGGVVEVLLYYTGLTGTVFDISGAILFTNLINRSNVQPVTIVEEIFLPALEADIYMCGVIVQFLSKDLMLNHEIFF